MLLTKLQVMKTIKGKDTYKEGYQIWHVWGTRTSKFYASKNLNTVKRKHPKLNINLASTNLETDYNIL